jgi:hypothetical protein
LPKRGNYILWSKTGAETDTGIARAGAQQLFTGLPNTVGCLSFSTCDYYKNVYFGRVDHNFSASDRLVSPRITRYAQTDLYGGGSILTGPNLWREYLECA